ncbi:hypothetical protein ACFW0U_18285, partial [Streptomyces albidoflavus]
PRGSGPGRCPRTETARRPPHRGGGPGADRPVPPTRKHPNNPPHADPPPAPAPAPAHGDDYPAELDEAWLEGVSTVGVTSGASVPDVLVEGVLEWLSTRGFEDVELVKAAEESITFSLPKELRRDLRAEAAALGSAE